MAGAEEFQSFVRKFVNLWKSGRHARLFVESEAGNAFANLQVSLGQAVPAGGGQGHGHLASGPSRQRRRVRRAEERKATLAAEEAAATAAAEEAAAATAAAEEAAVITTAEEAVDAKAAEEAAMNGFPSPIPQIDGEIGETDDIEYELVINAHQVVTDEDIVEVIETNFHCTLDDKKIEKSDPLRHLIIQKMEKKVAKKIENQNKDLKVFKITIRNNEIAQNVIEDWKIPFHMFDDRAFMNSINSEITIRLQEVLRL